MGIKENITTVKQELAWDKELLLEFKWSVSRGRDTYGWNICSLYANGLKVATCNGGGYDMQGTCLGNFITTMCKVELEVLARDAEFRKGNTISDGKEYNCYGLYHSITANGYDVKHHVYINGACGIDSVINICKRIGLTIKHMKTTERRTVMLMKVSMEGEDGNERV